MASPASNQGVGLSAEMGLARQGVATYAAWMIESNDGDERDLEANASVAVPIRPATPRRDSATPLLTEGEGLVDRKGAAAALDRSVEAVRRLEKKGTLHAAAVGPDGSRLYQLEEVRSVRRTVRTHSRSAADDFDGVTAAQVMGLLEDGVSPVAIVRETKLHPRTVAAIRAEWVALSGGYIVDEETARAISAARRATIRDAATLLANLTNVEPWVNSCTGCHEPFGDPSGGSRDPAYCAPCAEGLSAREAKRAAEQALAAREARKRAAEEERQAAAHEKASREDEANRRRERAAHEEQKAARERAELQHRTAEAKFQTEVLQTRRERRQQEEAAAARTEKGHPLVGLVENLVSQFAPKE
jgi:flagellar biosynthesis GTPase FlhF